MYSDTTKDGAVLANNVVSRHPTVNQSFIDKIVAEIEAKHPQLKNRQPLQSENDSENGKSHQPNTLKQLIDSVADNVVKEVTAEFTGQRHKPSRRVTLPKAPHQKKKTKVKMPLLNDHQSNKLGVKLNSAGEDDILPEMVNSDEITGKISPYPTPEDIAQSSLSHTQGTPHHRLSGPDPERPGLEEIRELFNSKKSKSRLKLRNRLKKKRPMTEEGKKKLTIPATTEGMKVCRNLKRSR